MHKEEQINISLDSIQNQKIQFNLYSFIVLYYF